MKIDFAKQGGLVPAVVQDSSTNSILMLGYMNQEALDKTRQDGVVTFFSRSRNKLWVKGETSGNKLKVVDILLDCDSDSLLIRAQPTGPTCHTGSLSCFGDSALCQLPKVAFLSELSEIIKDRKINPTKESYTSSLFKKGIKKIAQKVGEEGVEVALEAVAGDNVRLLEECADLFYHTLVLLEERQCSLDDIVEILRKRNKK